jgi:hypothetical protein
MRRELTLQATTQAQVDISYKTRYSFSLQEEE